ncbi:L-threonine 3-dehydrogenase [Sporomusa silvacetica DSM 10669]|uniref:L-threonine 3-dehydrogenase n=1 Tax=Sporomusa silvacetica DSM 10669 TaxID=1123289 RepID=A0ABZ3IFY3_9FIRM|nr:zinc-binding dehydrogenase [Sporomusa silvacetica]OZC16430.1 alcohol dehydrogenase [Sporomusa silvacetica DSM 10669]
MKAVILEKTCKATELAISNVPVPEVKPGWVLVRVKAFGVNRSELIMRSVEGDAPYIQLPRILGIECVGEIADPSNSHFSKGQRVVALMGGMGRSFDGSYAEYALLPISNVFAVDIDLSWEELAAIPETYFTAFGSLFECLQLTASDKILIRGGTSVLGLVAIQLAKSIGCSVLATTRNAGKLELLRQQGADCALLDDETLASQMHVIYPNGVSKVLELVGPATLKQSMNFLSYHGVVCATGMLGRQGTIENFDPIKDIPNGVYLSSFFSNYPTQEYMNKIFAHIRQYDLKPPIAKFFSLDDIAEAHLLMESNIANGKIVVAIAE